MRDVENKDAVERDMLTLSQKIATANQMADFDSAIEVVRCRQDILGSLKPAKNEVPLSLTGIKLSLEFTFQTQE